MGDNLFCRPKSQFALELISAEDVGAGAEGAGGNGRVG